MRRVVLALLILGFAASCKEAAQEKAAPVQADEMEAMPEPVIVRPQPNREPPAGPLGVANLQTDLKVNTAEQVNTGPKPVVMQQAQVFTRGAGLHVELSTEPVSCDEVTARFRRLHDGEVTLDMRVLELLQPDGTAEWGVSRTYYRGLTDVGVTGLTAKLLKRGPITEIEVKGSIKGLKNALLELDGTIRATDCGAWPTDSNGPRAQKQPVVVTVAGRPVPVQAALLDKSMGKWRLVLQDQPRDCKRYGEEPGLRVEFSIDPTTKQVVMSWINGALIGGSKSNQLRDASHPKLTIQGDVEGKGPLTLSLDGEVDVLGYKLTIKGSVQPLRCFEGQ